MRFLAPTQGLIGLQDRIFSRIRIWRGLGGLRRAFLLIALGGIAVLALPPLYIFPCLIFSFAAYHYWVLQASSWREAFAAGFFWHFGYFVCGLYWIGHAFLIDAGQFAWALPFPVFGLPAILALYGALHGVLAYGARIKLGLHGMGYAAFFVLSYVLLEIARGALFTGFPWNLMGYSLGFSLALSQSASLFGVYGLSALALAGVFAAVFLIDRKFKTTLVVACVFLALGFWGHWRIPKDVASYDDLRLRLVQANIGQKQKWNRADADRNFRRYLNLSQDAAQSGVDFIVWPETALPYPIDLNPAPRREMRKIIPPGGGLILGIPRFVLSPQGDVEKLYNSLALLDDGGDIVANYDKAHLVPFGEYMPLSHILPLKKLTPGMMNYSAGPRGKIIEPPLGMGLPPFAPLICYEAIFPGQVSTGPPQPQWILNLTNDAWFGHTAGPYQHLAQARMRAIEQGLPLIRVANTGISAVIDPFGRILGQIPLGKESFLDINLPKNLPNGTVYGKFGKI